MTARSASVCPERGYSGINTLRLRDRSSLPLSRYLFNSLTLPPTMQLVCVLSIIAGVLACPGAVSASPLERPVSKRGVQLHVCRR